MRALTLLEQSINIDYVALLLARNRCSLNAPIEDVLHQHQIPLNFLDTCMADPEFEAKIVKHVRMLQADGFSVEAKAAMLHEMGLPTVFGILQDPDAPAAARLKAHEQLGDIAQKGKLAAKQQQLGGAAERFTIQINIPSAPDKSITVDASPDTPALPTTTPAITITTTPTPATTITAAPDEADWYMEDAA